MIHITSTSFDIDGYLDITPLPTQGMSYSRRVARAATLDGGVAISDRGYSDGDRTLNIRYKPVSREHDERARRLLSLHPTVTVSMPGGVFQAAPQSLDITPSENTFTLLIIRNMSEG